MSKKLNLPMHFLALDKGFEKGRVLRQQLTEAEKVLWEEVRGNRLAGLKFRRQHPVGPYIADFYCHEFRLVIELDGAVHNDPEQIVYDQNRDEWMREYGVEVIRFTNDEVEMSLDRVKSEILAFVGEQRPVTSPPGPLSC